MVYVSSTGAIPEQPMGTKIKEVSKFEPNDPKKVVGAYSQSKAKASQMVMDSVKVMGLKARIVHPSGILGPNDHAVGETTDTLIKIIKGEKPMMTTFSVYNLARNNKFDYSKAIEELGYTTRSYKETIHDEVEWLKEEGLI